MTTRDRSNLNLFIGRDRWRGRIPIPKRAHPLVRRLIREANRQRTTLTEISQRSGICREAISEWRYRRCPTVANLEAALGALGLRLVVAEIEE